MTDTNLDNPWRAAERMILKSMWMETEMLIRGIPIPAAEIECFMDEAEAHIAKIRHDANFDPDE